MNEQIKKLAHTIVYYSLHLKEKDKVQITYQSPEELDLLKAIIEEIHNVGAVCFTKMSDPIIGNMLTNGTTDERIALLKAYGEFEVEHFDAFINMRYATNDYESKNQDAKILAKIGEALKEVQDIRTNQKEWVLLNYPSRLDAYKAKMPTEAFRKFAFDVMTVDYQKMASDIAPLKALMEKTDQVHIVGPNTDITFSIKGMPAIPCTGEKNIPDGELYSAPIKDSVNGIITYNTPCPYRGNVFHNVSLTFEKGKIVKATSDEGEEELNKIFDTDEGARYIGEFSLGFNPKILYPMGDILYDEKILGSLHFTPGRAYKDCYNGNDSSIHWDMVLIQREDFGGGEIYFDDVLIRKDGKFILDELKPLNYEEDA